MRPTREQLKEIFYDTLKFFDEDYTLREAVADVKRNVKVYPADFAQETDSHKAGNISVVKGRTLQTALKVHDELPDKRIAVLNFAASQNPGGGVSAGSLAQEESICRSSTLYPSLTTVKAYEGFYGFHAKSGAGWKASDTCIYSPDVVICRDDSDYIPARLSPENFVKVDVVTCAAPHVFRDVVVSDEDLYAIHLSRARNILRVCSCNNVDVFIGGAFGCGAFHNQPEIVAGAWKEALSVYREKFDSVIFAVYCSESETKNYTVFSSVLI